MATLRVNMMIDKQLYPSKADFMENDARLLGLGIIFSDKAHVRLIRTLGTSAQLTGAKRREWGSDP